MTVHLWQPCLCRDGWGRSPLGRERLQGEVGSGDASCPLVIIQQPLYNLFLARRRVGRSEIASVLTNQVVHGVPAVANLGEQTVPEESVKVGDGLGERDAS